MRWTVERERELASMLGDDSDLIEGDVYNLESADVEQQPLVADIGRSFIREKLADNTKKPQQWLEEIRARGSLKNPACGPLMSLLKHQGMQPCTAYARMLEQARLRPLFMLPRVICGKLAPTFRDPTCRRPHASFKESETYSQTNFALCWTKCFLS
jgi:hypothetical protein